MSDIRRQESVAKACGNCQNAGFYIVGYILDIGEKSGDGNCVLDGSVLPVSVVALFNIHKGIALQLSPLDAGSM